jgi:hypothetical protein
MHWRTGEDDVGRFTYFAKLGRIHIKYQTDSLKYLPVRTSEFFKGYFTGPRARAPVQQALLKFENKFIVD